MRLLWRVPCACVVDHGETNLLWSCSFCSDKILANFRVRAVAADYHTTSFLAAIFELDGDSITLDLHQSQDLAKLSLISLGLS